MRIIDFYSENHGPSMDIAEMLGEYENENEIEYVNFDEEVDVCEDYNVRQVPTVLFINNDVISYRRTGNITKEWLDRKINELTAV